MMARGTFDNSAGAPEARAVGVRLTKRPVLRIDVHRSLGSFEREGYPAGHWAKGGRGQPADLDEPVRSPAAAQRPVISPKPGSADHRPNKQTQPDGLTPTRKLLKAIIDAGGMLEIDTIDDNTSYRSLVGIINRRGMAPDGQEVIMVRGKSYHHTIFRMSSVSDWQTEPPNEIAAAERIGRWHPEVATLRNEKRLDSIQKELRGRAFRLLHALAREAEARGHSVRLPRRNHHGYIEDASKLGGRFDLQSRRHRMLGGHPAAQRSRKPHADPGGGRTRQEVPLAATPL